jgi:hypothetical protein
MSIMGQLYLEITELCSSGLSAVEISKSLASSYPVLRNILTPEYIERILIAEHDATMNGE